MLVLVYEDYNRLRNNQIWHVGDPVPKLERIQNLYADGHELCMIQAAMDQACVSNSGIEFIPPSSPLRNSV